MQVNAKDHGATGSGVEDETPSFHAALAALPPCGGTLFVPEGTYVIGDLTIGKSIVVQGNRSTAAAARPCSCRTETGRNRGRSGNGVHSLSW